MMLGMFLCVLVWVGSSALHMDHQTYISEWRETCFWKDLPIGFTIDQLPGSLKRNQQLLMKPGSKPLGFQ